MIDTVPLPERPVTVEIPTKLLREFEKEARVVLKFPWGIPVPEALLRRLVEKPEVYREITERFEIMLVPK